jgi:hypothetical protein
MCANTVRLWVLYNHIRVWYRRLLGSRGSVVGWNTMLQAGRSSVRVPDEVDFLIYVILPVARWPWGRLSLKQKWVPGIFLGVKSGRRVGLTTLPPSVSRMSENVGASTPRNPKGLHGLYTDNFTFTFIFTFIGDYLHVISSSTRVQVVLSPICSLISFCDVWVLKLLMRVGILMLSMNVLPYSVICSKFDFFTHICCICFVLCEDITYPCYCILMFFLYYGSLSTSWCLSQWWERCLSHVIFKWGCWLY